jgi:hypothetical protein
MDIPLGTVQLMLKQINPNDLVDVGLRAMQACFSGFTEPLDESSEYVQKGRALFDERFGPLGAPHESDLSVDRSLGRGATTRYARTNRATIAARWCASSRRTTIRRNRG